jgi:hypothetical protein
MGGPTDVFDDPFRQMDGIPIMSIGFDRFGRYRIGSSLKSSSLSVTFIGCPAWLRNALGGPLGGHNVLFAQPDNRRIARREAIDSQ